MNGLMGGDNDLTFVRQAFAISMKRAIAKRSIRWQDRSFKLGLFLFLCETEDLKTAYTLTRISAKANDFKKDYSNLAWKAANMQRHRTLKAEKIAVLEYYHRASDFLFYYAARGGHGAKRAIKHYGLNG